VFSFRRVALAVVALLAGIALPFVFSGSRAAGSAPLSITISGNQFLDGNGNTVRLLGVDRPSTEYACDYGYGYANGAGGGDPLSLADAQAIASWHANAVRIPLNEDCWLGINGLPAGAGHTSAGYQSAIESYVADLNSVGIYAILDLHWSAAGNAQADGQRGMPDDHSATFWTSVATAFKTNPAVVFDLFNEPTGYPGSGAPDPSFPLSWSCWLNGGCTMPNIPDGGSIGPTTPTYTAVGMQALVNAVRATGATQPLLLGGLSYANDLSDWLAYEPSDPDHQLAASFHNYTGESCATVSCWNSTIAPVAAQVPVVTGEFDEDDCPASGDDPGNFDNTYMGWADQHGVSYLAWGWYVDSAAPSCSDFFLVSDWSGTPLDPNGVALHDHLAALAQTTAGGPTTSSTPVAPSGPTTSSSSSSTLTSTSNSTLTSTSNSTPTSTSTTPRAPAAARLALRITTLHVAHGRLTCSGVLARGFSGSLSVTVMVTVRGHGNHAHALRKTLRAKTKANAGRFRFTLGLAPGGALTQVTVSYAGGRYFAAGSISKR
jgi:endoglucanase